jgi:phosphatidylserine/phosphatidylglycerophosphate/cardiolipin synthase-like enzyme
MHHKFLVFCRYSINEELAWPYIPYAVWTGSFNITKNGSRSLENAVYIQHPEVAMHYFFEWQQILEVSETLDWTSPYAAPDIQFNDGAVFS